MALLFLIEQIYLLMNHSDQVFFSLRKDQELESHRSKYELLFDDPDFKGPIAGIMSAAKMRLSRLGLLFRAIFHC
ncbi:MAG: hypothetical protein Ct9H90mP13_10440 [Pseudomonadota bacterium]|nr:MAG: hypothetical protein Ct9H90mP13_10440 [Pseudomonadota bacterium]